MKTATWDRVVHHVDGTPLGPEPLRGLIEGDHAVVVLKGLLPDEVLTSQRERIFTLFDKANTTRYVNGQLTIIGLYLVKYLSHVDDYFRDARDAEALTASASVDLAARTREALRRTFGMRRFDVAVEPDGRRYASSNIRIYADTVDTPLHNDHIARDAASHGLLLSGLKHQLSCVVCLQECDGGGELTVYRKPWEPADEKFKIPGGLGYDLGVVEGLPKHQFKPQAGDVYILNPTNFHAIERVYGADRLTLGFFFGFFDDVLEEGVAWI